jgi:NUDIX domain
LECDETGAMCAARETFEECGVTVDPSEYRLISVLTDPSVDKNVTLRYRAILNDFPEHNKDYKGSGGEEDEVEKVKWLDLDDEKFINGVEWAFNHRKIIKKLKKQIKNYK